MDLTIKQKEALNSILDGKNVFLTGPGGTGKSHLLKIFIERYNKINILSDSEKELYVTSTTGISSLLINGKTLHSYAGIGLGNKSYDFYIDKIKKNYKLKNRWRNTKILIIDEISMLEPELFEKLEIIARKVRNNEKKFGGIQLVISGDFLQLPPVNSNKLCFESNIWSDMIDKTFYFQENLRQDNKEFQDILNKIRLGNVDEDVKNCLTSCINRNKTNLLIEPTILYSKRHMVKEYNSDKLKLLSSNDKQIYKSTIEYKNIKDEYKEAYADIINKMCDVENEIELTIGTQVMLVVNGIDDNLANGSIGKIIKFDNNYPVVLFTNGIEKLITEYKWSLSDDNKKEPNVYKFQIPLVLAWAITIHRAQGATLDYIETDLGYSIFEYGQVYVVLSRVKTKEGIFIKNINFNKIKANPKAIEFYNNLI
jgi:ATP-dependent DNA helicase PIF1